MLSTFKPSSAPQTQNGQPQPPSSLYPSMAGQPAQPWGQGYPSYPYAGPSAPGGQVQPYGQPYNPYSTAPSQLAPGQAPPSQLVTAPQSVRPWNPFLSQSTQPSQPSQPSQPGALQPTAQLGGGAVSGPLQQQPLGGVGSWRPYQAQTQLTPQPLESVSKDEDPVYGPLGRARGKVERALVADNEISPDLADLLAIPSGSMSSCVKQR